MPVGNGKVQHAGREVLLDVTRLVWRAWRGQRPTGIDRVCLAYVEHFRERALAVIQREGFKLVLPEPQSDTLFALFLAEGRKSKLKVSAAIAGALLMGMRSPARAEMLYLNVGHTGLDDPSLSTWIAKNRLRAVYLVHDLIPITNPEFCRVGEAEKHEQRMTFALRSAAGIVGNSQATIDELNAFATERNLPRPPSIAALISGYEQVGDVRPLTFDRPYFVVVGTIEARKNHLLLLEVWQRLFRRMGSAAPLLIIAGQRGWEADAAIDILDRPGTLAGTIREIGDCDDELLASLIAGARALLMPSFAEGFGLPIVEALGIGTPVIASDLPVFREIAGNIPLYLDPRDPVAWEVAIEDFRDDGLERLRQLAEIEGYKSPSWAEHFNILKSWMKTAIASADNHSKTADFELCKNQIVF